MRSATGWRRRRSAARREFDVLQPGREQDGRDHAGRARRRARRPPKCRSAAAARLPAPRSPTCRRGLPSASACAAETKGVAMVDIAPQLAGRRLRLPAARHRARGQWRGDRHCRKAQAGRRGGFALVALHGRARRPADPPGAALLMADLFARPIARRSRSQARPLADRLRPIDARRGGRPGASDRRGRRADAHDPRRLARLDDLLGAARHRQDDGGAAACRRHRSRLRADLGDLFRRRRSQEGVRDGAAAPHQRPPDAALRRRDPPLQPGAAGFLPAGHGGRHGHPGRRDHREPVLRAQRRAAVARPRAGLPHARRGEPRQAARRAPSSRRHGRCRSTTRRGRCSCAWPTATAAPR